MLAGRRIPSPNFSFARNWKKGNFQPFLIRTQTNYAQFSDSSHILVTNLPKNSQDNILTKMFERYGNFERVHPINSDDNSTYGIVKMKKKDAEAAYYGLRKLRIGSQRVTLKILNAKEERNMGIESDEPIITNESQFNKVVTKKDFLDLKSIINMPKQFESPEEYEDNKLSSALKETRNKMTNILGSSPSIESVGMIDELKMAIERIKLTNVLTNEGKLLKLDELALDNDLGKLIPERVPTKILYKRMEEIIKKECYDQLFGNSFLVMKVHPITNQDKETLVFNFLGTANPVIKYNIATFSQELHEKIAFVFNIDPKRVKLNLQTSDIETDNLSFSLRFEDDMRDQLDEFLVPEVDNQDYENYVENMKRLAKQPLEVIETSLGDKINSPHIHARIFMANYIGQYKDQGALKELYVKYQLHINNRKTKKA